jgi:hypothetical protein
MQIQESSKPLEDVEAEVLLLFHLQDEPAPRGRLGWVDWVLGGAVSRLRARGKFAGEQGANALLSPGGKLRSRMILVIGLGRQADLSMLVLYRLSYVAAHTILALGCTQVAIDPPCRAFPREAPSRIHQAFLEGFTAELNRGRPDAAFSLTVLPPPNGS